LGGFDGPDVGVADGAGADEGGAVGFLVGRHGFKELRSRKNGPVGALSWGQVCRLGDRNHSENK
jgi:hypothetical protein